MPHSGQCPTLVKKPHTHSWTWIVFNLTQNWGFFFAGGKRTRCRKAERSRGPSSLYQALSCAHSYTLSAASPGIHLVLISLPVHRVRRFLDASERRRQRGFSHFRTQMLSLKAHLRDIMGTGKSCKSISGFKCMWFFFFSKINPPFSL